MRHLRDDAERTMVQAQALEQDAERHKSQRAEWQEALAGKQVRSQYVGKSQSCMVLK